MLSLATLGYTSTFLRHLLGSFRFVAAYRKIKQVKTSNKVEKSIYYMNEQIDRFLSLNKLATQCGLSISHDCLVFKKHTSSTPLEYFTRLKMQKACSLLDLSVKSIKEVAHSLGFEDQYYFTWAYYNYGYNSKGIS